MWKPAIFWIYTVYFLIFILYYRDILYAFTIIIFF